MATNISADDVQDEINKTLFENLPVSKFSKFSSDGDDYKVVRYDGNVYEVHLRREENEVLLTPEDIFDDGDNEWQRFDIVDFYQAWRSGVVEFGEMTFTPSEDLE
jgi:hypothetical protein